ncbi:MAG TPA: hypothetical protein VMV38_01020, partial [Candidatus Paceibacterota bacterium]|nr:hypothetical protein [Candidatus Paceibacterota bacterium]
MNTKTIVGVGILVVVLSGGVGYLVSNAIRGNTGVPTATTTPSIASSTIPSVTPSKTVSQKTPPKSYTYTPSQPTKTTAKMVGIGSLSYLLSLKEPLVCSVKIMSGFARSGTLYVAGGSARADFTNSSMIDDGAYLYAWVTGATTGIKLLAPLSVSGSAIANNGGIDPATNLSFSCN